MRTYQEMAEKNSFLDRFEYLKLSGKVGDETFGCHRWLNQVLYTSPEWRSFRDRVIRRDNGCDLGILGREIFGTIIIHHLNPITIKDIVDRDPKVFDLNNVVCTSFNTHNAIHYGDKEILIADPIERSANDTCPWRTQEVRL